jgi:NADH:ubiquinone oxidoreductase subunit F (NADH-binding)/NADH:ubiquinone oxidoreductase subunit E
MIHNELRKIQDEHGYLPSDELSKLSDRSGVPLHRLNEVISFFPHYRQKPRATVEVRVCRDLSCWHRGAADCIRALEALAAEVGGDQIDVGGVSCLGQCDGPIAISINDHIFRGGDAGRYRGLVQSALAGAIEPTHVPIPAGPTGWKIDPYDGRDDFAAIRSLAESNDVNGLIEQLKIADLRGMGGAGVPAHQKWNDVRQAPGNTKYVVCNGDESEPATFKDRELLLRTPRLVLEGLLLGAFVIKADKVIIYIRHEYEPQIEAMREAVRHAKDLGVTETVAKAIGHPLEVEVFVSPGGYICGEASALIEAIEGKRAEPRNKPPQLETNGLYDCPTLLSNVETFAWVPSIAVHGGAWYRDQGVNGCAGLRFFSISGDVVRPGAYEVPNGLTLRSLIEDHAGGMRDGRQLHVFAPSGPSGGFLPRLIPADGLPARVREQLGQTETHIDILDYPLDLNKYREIGLMLGAGVVAYAEGVDLLAQALSASRFFRDESCGKCVPCRVGTWKITELAQSLVEGRGAQLETIEPVVLELQRAMEQTSICGLGAVGANPFASLFRFFRADLAKAAAPPQRTPR